MSDVHVLEVSRHDRVGAEFHRLKLTVESHPTEVGCPGCGVIAMIHGRRLRRLHDIPAFGAPVEVVWRQRRYRCLEPACPMTGFTEDHDASVRRTVGGFWRSTQQQWSDLFDRFLEA